MYKISYADVLDDNPSDARERECEAVGRSIELMRCAEAAGVNSIESTQAVAFLTKLWSMLIEDLGRQDNDLPDALRAQLISIGIWLMKQAEAIRSGGQTSFADMITVSEAIRDGLK
ncbi:MAG: flagellar biosynthesis regulator FlaF [Alphaproteobacteria bacterium]|nr:flagellar biosynthesis regulator FlaF [Alphaproteobacteria bacterium]